MYCTKLKALIANTPLVVHASILIEYTVVVSQYHCCKSGLLIYSSGAVAVSGSFFGEAASLYNGSFICNGLETNLMNCLQLISADQETTATRLSVLHIVVLE